MRKELERKWKAEWEPAKDSEEVVSMKLGRRRKVWRHEGEECEDWRVNSDSGDRRPLLALMRIVECGKEVRPEWVEEEMGSDK